MISVSCHFMFLHAHNIALPTCKLNDIEVSNIVYCMVMAKIASRKSCMGVPNFMEGSLISYEIGDPMVPPKIFNWGSRSLISYKNGDPGSPFWGVPTFI